MDHTARWRALEETAVHLARSIGLLLQNRRDKPCGHACTRRCSSVVYTVESSSHFTLERCLPIKPAAKPSSATSSATPAKRKSRRLILSAHSTRTESSDAMSQPQYAPAATAGGQQNGPVSEIQFQSDALHSSPRAQSRLLPVIR